jgi:hypothetical protein
VFVSVVDLAELGYIFDSEEKVGEMGDISKIMSCAVGSSAESRGEELGLGRMGISIGIDGLQRK